MLVKRCLRHTRHAQCLIPGEQRQWTEGRGLLTPSLGWLFLASAIVMHTHFVNGLYIFAPLIQLHDDHAALRYKAAWLCQFIYIEGFCTS